MQSSSIKFNLQKPIIGLDIYSDDVYNCGNIAISKGQF